MGLHYLGGGNNEGEMVWVSIIWAGGKIIDGKWFGSPLFGRGGNNGEENGLGLYYLGGDGKIMDGKWFGSPLFTWAGGGEAIMIILGCENDGNEMVWASIAWVIAITTGTITTITVTISITITRLVLAAAKIMETKWFGPPLFGREGK